MEEVWLLTTLDCTTTLGRGDRVELYMGEYNRAVSY